MGTSILALAAVPNASFAQTAASAEGEELAQAEAPTGGAESQVEADNSNTIVVTGIRRALETARNIKRNSDTFVDSITASDVATLPDLSVAEALGRVPGVSVSRFPSGGASPDFPSPEGRGNLVRGLGYVRSEFNGRDAFTANAGRALDWSSIPPELVGAVDVFKNQTADLIEGGISGTINLRTLEPFDRKDRFAAAALDFTYSDLRKKWSPQGSLTLGDRWQTSAGEFGAIVSYSKSKLASRIHGWQQGAPTPRRLSADGTMVPIYGGGGGPERINEVLGVPASQIVATTTGYQIRKYDFDRDRTSYYGALQWQNDRLKLTGKYVRSRTDIDALENTLEHWMDRGPGRNEFITDLAVDPTWSSAGLPFCNGEGGQPTNPGDCETLIPIGGGLMESGLVSSVEDSWTGMFGSEARSLGIGKKEKALTSDISLNGQWEVTDRLTASFDAHRTKASAKTRQIWGGLHHWNSYRINHDLDDPSIEFFVVPGNTFNPGFTRFAGDDNGTPIPSATSLDDPNGYNVLYGSDIFQKGSGKLHAVRGDLNYELGDGSSWFDAVKFGARHAVRKQVNNEAGENWGGIAPAWGGNGGYAVVGTLQDQSFTESVDFSDFFRGGVVQGNETSFRFVDERYLNNWANFSNYLNTEPQLALGTVWQPRLVDDGSAWGQMVFRPQDTSDIVEKTRNAYVRLDFGNEFGDGMSIDGNIGLRYVRTDLESSGFRGFNDFDADPIDPVFINGVRVRTDDAESRDSPRDFLPETTAYLDQAPVPVDFKVKETHWLPSLNAKLNINPEMLFRVGVSKGLSRPDVQVLAAGQEYRVDTVRLNPVPITDPTNPLFGVDQGAISIMPGQIRVSAGAIGRNPLLKPTTAWNYDLSYEYYFKGGYVSVAGFLKKLKDIQSRGEIPLGTETLDGVEVPIVYSGSINQAKATVKGFEIAYQQFYDFLPGILSNFGTQANYTFVDAKTTPPTAFLDADGDGSPDGGQTTVYRFGVDDMLGQSKHLANFVGIYQDDKLELRLAYNWRSRYLTTYRDYVQGAPIFVSAAGNLDASIKYQMTRQLQLRASAANLLDTKSKARGQVDQAGQMYDRFSFINDRRFVIGALAQF